MLDPVTFFGNLIADCKENDSSIEIAAIRSQSITARVSGVAIAVLASIIFIKTLGLPILTTYLGFSLTAFVAVLAHDLMQVGINQSKAISSANSSDNPDSFKQAATGTLKKVGWLANTLFQQIAYSEYELQDTYLLRPLKDFIIAHSKK